jgi:NAD(P)-dependent dehydrogenase (short-subunit alcohol dehydrogenase family)
LSKLNEKVAVVTGGASGFGLEISTLFLSEGARVMMADVDLPRLKDRAAELAAKHGKSVLYSKADVSSVSDVESLFEETSKAFGAVDSLVNCAGVWLLPKPTIETSEELWDRTIDINLKGTFLTNKYALKQMIPRKRGTIVNFGSIMGLVGYSEDAPYCASKGGVVLLTKAIALEVAPHGIRVNAICPGASKTPMYDRFAAAQKDPQKAMAEEAARIPLGRFATTKEIALTVLFLSSDESSYITGAEVPVDGGWTAQ